MTPHWVEDEHGRVQLSSIATYGETQHLFVQREDYKGAFLPGFEKRGKATHDPDAMRLMAIDHIVGNVELGHMQEWVGYYERVFGMTEMIHFSDEAISTEYSALMSKVVTDGAVASSSRSTSPPRASASRRSRSTSSTTSGRRPAHRHRHARHRGLRRRAP